MNFKLTKPCAECPFTEYGEQGFTTERLEEFASGSFGCHLHCELKDSTYQPKAGDKTPFCAGMLIYLEKQGRSNNIMRIAERLGLYDPSKMDMTAKVREVSKEESERLKEAAYQAELNHNRGHFKK